MAHSAHHCPDRVVDEHPALKADRQQARGALRSFIHVTTVSLGA